MNFDPTKINYKALAKALHEYQLEMEHMVTEETTTPIGIIEEKEALDDYKKISREEAGLDILIKDLIRIKADIHYRKSAWWDHNAYRHFDMDRSAKYQIDLKTGEVFKTAYGYEDILKKLESEEYLKFIKDKSEGESL